MQFLAVWVPFSGAISFLFLHVSGRTCLLAEAVLCPGLEVKSQTPLGKGGPCILAMTSPLCNLAATALFDYLEPPVRSGTMIGSTTDITYSHLFPRWSSLFPDPGGSACALTLAKISPFLAPRKGNKGFRKVTRKFSAGDSAQVSQLCRAYGWTVSQQTGGEDRRGLALGFSPLNVQMTWGPR